jgi:hypothetical protein
VATKSGHPDIGISISRGALTSKPGLLVFCLGNASSLENIVFGLEVARNRRRMRLLNLEPLKELLWTPALRFVRFNGFYFNELLLMCSANALEGSSIIDITFDGECTFPEEG